jgi:PIN domain nuclease of toxin-antitoxin system
VSSEITVDTPILARWLIGSRRITTELRRVLEDAPAVYIPPCSLHEMTLKVRKGRWPEMEPYAPHLGRICVTNGIKIAPYTARMAILAGSMEWDHPDPFDRMIGVTAFEMGMALVSSDEAFDMLERIQDGAAGFGTIPLRRIRRPL